MRAQILEHTSHSAHFPRKPGTAISHLSYDLRWFRIVNSSKILLHGSIKVFVLIQIVAVFAKNDILEGRVSTTLLYNLDRKHIETSLVEDLEFFLQRFLMIAENLQSSVSSDMGIDAH